MSASSGGLADAIALIEVGQPSKALPLLQSHMASYPDDAEGHARLAQALLDLRDYVPAKAAAQRAIALDPQDDFSFRLLALAWAHLGYRREAIEAAETAQSLAPNHWATHQVRASVDLLIGKYSEAGRAALGPLLELAPDLVTTHTTVAAYPLTTDTLLPQYREIVRAHIMTALQIDPQNAYALYLLGKLESRTFGRTTKALVPALDMLAAEPTWSINRGATLSIAVLNVRWLAWAYTLLLLVDFVAVFTPELLDYTVTATVTAVIALACTVAYVVLVARTLGRRALRLLRVLFRISGIFVLRLVVMVISLAALLLGPLVPPDVAEYTTFLLPPVLFLTGTAALFDALRETRQAR